MSESAVYPPPPMTLCVVCDAEEGQCEHNGWRYVEGHGSPDWEQERLDKIEAKYRDKKTKVVEQARDVQDIVDELADTMYLDPPLEANLRTTHALDPLGVSRLAAATIQGASTGKLTSPGGFLAKRLGEIRGRKTKAP